MPRKKALSPAEKPRAENARVEYPPDWITAAVAAKMLGINHVTFPKVAASGEIRVKRLPGLQPRYCLADVERLAASCVAAKSEMPAPRPRGNTTRRAFEVAS